MSSFCCCLLLFFPILRGFCYFNSVAIAAKLLQQRLSVSKILIVDWVSFSVGCLLHDSIPVCTGTILDMWLKVLAWQETVNVGYLLIVSLYARVASQNNPFCITTLKYFFIP